MNIEIAKICGLCAGAKAALNTARKEIESGKKVVLAGISAGFLLTSCSPIDTIKELIRPTVSPLEGDVPAVEYTELMGETVTEEEEPLAGEPVIEGLLEVPETEIEEGETEPEEIVEFDGVPVIDTEGEDCEAIVEDEEEYLVAGGIVPADFEEDELVLEGDVIYPPEEEEQP